MNPRLRRALAAVLLTSALSLAILAWVLQLWRADLSVPFAYSKDALWTGTAIKGVIENGWYLMNDRLGAPLGQDLRDYPTADGIHWLTVWLLTLFVHNWAMVANLFFLLTFPLTALCALLAFKQLGLSYRWAIVGALLYAFLPYHFARGELHLFLSAYYLVPLAAMVALWVYQYGDLLAPSAEGKRQLLPGSRRGAAAIVVCLAVGCGGVYYALFAAFFFLLAGVMGASWRRDAHHLGTAVRLSMIVGAALMLNVLPTVAIRCEQGKNPQAVQRAPLEVEWFGLKLAQMLLPVPGHRWAPFARLSHRYSANAPLVSENDSAALGAIAGIGLVILLGRLLLRPVEDGGPAPAHVLGAFTASAIFLSTIGGISSILYLTALPFLRAYNRISVYIAFFALLVVLQLLDRLSRRPSRSAMARLLAALAPAAVLAVGVLDQTSALDVPPYRRLQALYERDARFTGKVDAALPPGSMVFQLPYLAFPENGGVNGTRDYDPFVTYLHSKTLRWSYGAIQGRECDQWQRDVSALPPARMVGILRQVGFGGVTVDRRGYVDQGAAILRELQRAAGTPPVVSEDGRLVLFVLAPARIPGGR